MSAISVLLIWGSLSSPLLTEVTNQWLFFEMVASALSQATLATHPKIAHKIVHKNNLSSFGCLIGWINEKRTTILDARYSEYESI